jgi:Cu/Ag efflux pump CusA
MKTWAMTLAMNKVLALAINNVLMMLVVPALMAEHVRGIKMTMTIWRTYFGPLDQRYCYKREVYKI